MSDESEYVLAFVCSYLHAMRYERPFLGTGTVQYCVPVNCSTAYPTRIIQYFDDYICQT